MAAESLQTDIDGIHHAASALLLHSGTFQGDGHYHFSDRPELGITFVRVTDYDSLFSVDYSGQDIQASHRNLLEAGEAFINIEVIDENQDSHTLLVPARVRPKCVYHSLLKENGINFTNTANILFSQRDAAINDLGAIALLHKIGF